MRKQLIFAFAALSMLACTEKNTPNDDGGGNSSSSSTSSAAVEGELTGVFSISPEKKVHFSKGNLQYQASTNTWRFAEKQYDIIGDANKNFSASYAGWIDLMGFGTTGFYCAPYDLKYKLPQYISNNTIDNINGTCADWGEVCAISNGGNEIGLWRTITGDEWNYLIEERQNADQLHGTATVDGIRGEIILPDGWSTPSGLKWTGSPTSANQRETDWVTNQYSETQWKKMEQNGAVFIPCVGCAVGQSMSSSYDGGIYWSASCKWDGSSYGGRNMIIIGDIFYFGASDEFRFAVRLVKDINETNGTQGNGKCGDNLTWNLKDGVLTISGSGDMDDENYDVRYDVRYDNFSITPCYYSTTPWWKMRKNITSIVIETGVTSIGDGAFCGCTGLTSVTIGNGVTSIGKYAFGGCTSLTSVTIPNSVTSIDWYAFAYCSGLTSVMIPNSVTSIKSYAFFYCTGLTSVTIPNSVTSIGSSAFSGCSSLTSVTIPNSVIEIGDFAFEGCSSLTSVTIPNSVIEIGDYAFEGCSGLTSVTIPNSVTSIGNNAFRNCTGLASIEIPNSITSMEYGAFSYCRSLTSITIPNSVTSIGDFAFAWCTGLKSMTCLRTSPPSCMSSTFEGVSTSIPIYVPASAVSKYKSADVWKNFTNIKAISE